jgi:tRNA-specific 2-thiouridylase
MQKNESVSEKKVLVGISGGVDSAVALALLKKSNCAVEAVFLRLTDTSQKAKESLQDAKKICQLLAVPLHIKDARAVFEKTVIKYFLAEYAKGNTPNPCVFCNEQIKFKLLLALAKKLKFDFVATGHYARIKKVKDGAEIKYKLVEAKDEKKDQSYFLYRLKQEQLAKIIFPLGDYQKDDVRELAKKFNLPVFNKLDSQDVCFMQNNKLEEFLRKKIKLTKGAIIDTKNKIIGEHKSLALYTIGQRKGIEIGGSGPYFVIAKNLKKNQLIVTNNPAHPALSLKKINLKKLSWTDACPRLPLAVLVRTRYHNFLESAIIKTDKAKKAYWLELRKPQKAVAPGQSAVFYTKNGEILGGGIIK